MQHIHNMEIQSDGARTSIQDATEILHNTSVWEFYRSVVATASRGGAGVMDQRTLDSATYLLAHACCHDELHTEAWCRNKHDSRRVRERQ